MGRPALALLNIEANELLLVLPDPAAAIKAGPVKKDCIVKRFVKSHDFHQ